MDESLLTPNGCPIVPGWGFTGLQGEMVPSAGGSGSLAGWRGTCSSDETPVLASVLLNSASKILR